MRCSIYYFKYYLVIMLHIIMLYMCHTYYYYKYTNLWGYVVNDTS